MESMTKIVSACADTLVLNCYPTNGTFQVQRRETSSVLRGELEQVKKLARMPKNLSPPASFSLRRI